MENILLLSVHLTVLLRIKITLNHRFRRSREDGADAFHKQGLLASETQLPSTATSSLVVRHITLLSACILCIIFMTTYELASDDVGKVGHGGGAAPITRLATELLSTILEYAAQDSNYRYEHCASSYDQDMTTILMLVCRRFHNVAQGFRLRTVALTWRSIRDARILVDNRKHRRAHLYRFPSSCRFLILTWRHDCNDGRSRWSRKLEKTRNLVHRMNNVRCFRFESESMDPASSPSGDHAMEKGRQIGWNTFGNLVQGFERLQHLVIKRAHLGDLVPACRGIKQLRTLDLVEVWERDHDFVLQSEDRRSAPFKELRLFNYRGRESSLRELLRWPIALEDLSWGNARDGPTLPPVDENMWSIPVLDHLLRPHRGTLKLIKVGHKNFNHEGPPLLTSWILPLIELFEYMLEPKCKGHTWYYGFESPYHAYMERYSDEGRYINSISG